MRKLPGEGLQCSEHLRAKRTFLADRAIETRAGHLLVPGSELILGSALNTPKNE